MKVIGIAGPAGSGKSTVARLLSCRPGFAYVDCDELGWSAYLPGRSAYAPLVARFGRGILDQDGTVNRSRLSAIALASPEAKRDLEAIVHPKVMAAVRRVIAEHQGRGTQVLLVEGALLLSSPHVDLALFDAFVWLSAPEAERRRRLLGCGLAREAVERRLSAQRDLAAPETPRVHVVDGQGPPSEVADRLLALLDTLRGC